MSAGMGTELPCLIFLHYKNSMEHFLVVHKYHNCAVFNKNDISKDICLKKKKDEFEVEITAYDHRWRLGFPTVSIEILIYTGHALLLFVSWQFSENSYSTNLGNLDWHT